MWGWIYSGVSSYCIPAGPIRLPHLLSAFANKRAKSSLVVRKYVHWIPDYKGARTCVWKYVYSTCGYKEEDKKKKDETFEVKWYNE